MWAERVGEGAQVSVEVTEDAEWAIPEAGKLRDLASLLAPHWKVVRIVVRKGKMRVHESEMLSCQGEFGNL